MEVVSYSAVPRPVTYCTEIWQLLLALFLALVMAWRTNSRRLACYPKQFASSLRYVCNSKVAEVRSCAGMEAVGFSIVSPFTVLPKRGSATHRPNGKYSASLLHSPPVVGRDKIPGYASH